MRALADAARRALCWLALLAAAPLQAAVQDVTVANVTPRSFAVVWAADEPIAEVTLRVFADAAGSSDITQTLSVDPVSMEFDEVHANGLAMVEARGLEASTTVYVQLETTTASGTVLYPPAPPLLAVTTASLTTVESLLAPATMLVDDVLRYDFFAPDGVTPVADGILLLAAPGLAAYPLAVPVPAQAGTLPRLHLELRNLYDAAGRSAELAAGAPLRLDEMLGLGCPRLVDHRRPRFRRLPGQAEAPPVSTIEAPLSCYGPDLVCDGVVDVLDFQFSLQRRGATVGDCGFLPELDLITDGVVDDLDSSEVIGHFGETEPF